LKLRGALGALGAARAADADPALSPPARPGLGKLAVGDLGLGVRRPDGWNTAHDFEAFGLVAARRGGRG